MKSIKKAITENINFLIAGLFGSILLFIYGYFTYCHSVQQVKIYALTDLVNDTEPIYVSGYHVPEKIKVRTNKVVPKKITSQNVIRDYKHLGDFNNFQLKVSAKSDNLLIFIKNGRQTQVSPLVVLNIGEFNLNRIEKVIYKNDIQLVFVNHHNTKFLIGKEDGNVDFSTFNTLNKNKVLICLCASLVFGLLCYLFLKYHIIFELKRLLNLNPIYCYGLLVVLILEYLAIFPGIYGMDCIAYCAWAGRFTTWFGAMYSLFANLLSVVDFNFIVVINILIFYIAMVLPSFVYGAIGKKRQLALLILISLFTFCPALFVSIFGVQRITTNNVLEMLFWSFMLCILINNSWTIEIMNLSMVLLFILIAFRIENFVYIIPYVYLGLKSKTLQVKVLKVGIAVTLILFSINSYITYENSNEIQTMRYKAISLNAMLKPYITDKSKVPLYFKKGIHDGALAKVNQKMYKETFQYFISNIAKNPKPYLMGCMDRFLHASLDENTWGHSYNKYDLYRIERSSHRKVAFQHFLIFTDICPFGEKIYNSITHYMHINKPFFLNGILFSVIVIIFINPFLLNQDLFNLLNRALILKFVFTFLLAPAGYALYYYDMTIWMFFLIYVSLLLKGSPFNPLNFFACKSMSNSHIPE